MTYFLTLKPIIFVILYNFLVSLVPLSQPQILALCDDIPELQD